MTDKLAALPDALWEKYSTWVGNYDGDHLEVFRIDKPDFTAAIKEAMQAQRKRDAEICRTPLGPRLTDKDDYWSERYAAAIEREPI